jgi:hypothetical protein
MLPYSLIWGVDVAIKKLRPGANFQLEGTNFTIWNDPSGLPAPSWEEVQEQMEKDRLAAEEWETKHGSSST